MDTIGTDSIRKTILLAVHRPRWPSAIRARELERGGDGATVRAPKHAVHAHVLLEGAFTSAFVDRLPPNFINDPSVGYREKGRRSAQLVVSDGDVIDSRVDQAKGMFYTWLRPLCQREDLRQPRVHRERGEPFVERQEPDRPLSARGRSPTAVGSRTASYTIAPGGRW